MCAIIQLDAGKELSFHKLRNVVLNNPDGYGLVIVDKDHIEVRKHFDPKGNDPERIAKELEKSKKSLRYLHVRYATIGEKNEQNTHPFTVYNSGKGHRIEFMHNGSLYKFRKTGSEDSDTKCFANDFIVPLLAKIDGKNGRADIEEPIVEKVLSEYFGTNNRGLLISNKLTPLFLGSWDTIKDGNDTFVVSNDDYFDDIKDFRVATFYKNSHSLVPAKGGNNTNSPRFPWVNQSKTPGINKPDTTPESNIITLPKNDNEPSEAGAATDNEDETTLTTVSGHKVTPLKNIDLRMTGRFLLPQDINGLLGQPANDFDDDLYDYLTAVSSLELRQWTTANPQAAALLLEHCFMKVCSLIEDYNTVCEKHSKASKKIEELITGGTA